MKNNAKKNNAKQYIKNTNLAKRLGISRLTLDTMEAKGDIPKGTRISQRVKIFDKEAVSKALGVVLWYKLEKTHHKP